ncbi:MAG: glycosyltransferase family 2 protein [Candidatus Ventricola sp.]
MKRFAIITVCRNAGGTLEDTIRSVLEQTCSDLEYIVEDGMSGDQTLRIAQSFCPAFAQRGIPYRVISRPDRGIYDAMNQAAREARGEWVLYMNAGDRFADRYVLETVLHSGRLEAAEIVYGDKIDHAGSGYLYQKAHPIERMRDRLPFCHQSVFVRKALYDQRPYALCYRLCSDYHFFYHWYQEGKTFAYVPIAISIFDRHGVSSDGKAVAQELLRIHEDMPVRDEAVIRMLRDEAARYDAREPLYHRVLAGLIPKAIRQRRWARIQRAKGWMTEEEFMAQKRANGGSVNPRIP